MKLIHLDGSRRQSRRSRAILTVNEMNCLSIDFEYLTFVTSRHFFGHSPAINALSFVPFELAGSHERSQVNIEVSVCIDAGHGDNLIMDYT